MMLTAGLLCSAVLASAQVESPMVSQKEADSKVVFNPHFFMQIQAGAAYTRGEGTFGDLISPAAALSFGYKFNPLFGIRAGVNGWQAKGIWVAPHTGYDYRYLQGDVDAMLDLSNLFGGFNPDRVFNAYLFAGVGVSGAFDNDEAVALAEKGYAMEYLWKERSISPVGRLGLGMDLRITDRLAFNVEVNSNVLNDKFNSKKGNNADWQFNALAGFTIRFGKSYRKTAPVYYEPAAEQVPPEKEVVEKVSEPVVTPVQEEQKVEVQTLRKDVFFKINSASVRSNEMDKLVCLSQFLIEHPEVKVQVCGYADKDTGTKKFNMQLSQKRAEAVAKILKDKGVEASRITVDYKGDTVQPFQTAEENRVVICITE